MNARSMLRGLLAHRALAFALAVWPLAACSPPAGASTEATLGFLVTDDGVHLAYRAVGNGPDTVLVLHGGPGVHMGYLTEALDPLARSRTLIYYDQRGRGRSELVADSRIDAAADVRDLESVRRHFGLERITAIGHNWGAALATLYAAEHPERVERFVFVSPFFVRSYLVFALLANASDFGVPDTLPGYAHALGAGLDRSDPTRFCRDYWGVYFWSRKLTDVELMRQLQGSVCDAPTRALARAGQVSRRVVQTLGKWDWRSSPLQVPVLVVQGTGGKLDRYWLGASYEWLEALPQGRLLLLPEPADFPWLASRRRFVRALDRFLGGQWPKGAQAYVDMPYLTGTAVGGGGPPESAAGASGDSSR